MCCGAQQHGAILCGPSVPETLLGDPSHLWEERGIARRPESHL
jgi:hypothetical protein